MIMKNTLIIIVFLIGLKQNIRAELPANIIIYLTDSVKLEMVYISPGEFFMGSPDTEAGRQSDEGPVRKVTISKGYYLGKYEVTQQQWQTIMGNNPSVFHKFPDSPQRPVERVSWDDSQLFLDRLNSMGFADGLFRLPTEAEWEYACRAGSTERFPWGIDSNFRELHQNAWFFSRSEGQSHPVGTKKPNAWGLYDMHGSVWEWTSDWMGSYDGADLTDPKGPETGERKIIRGGSWFNEPEALRCANRNAHITKSRQTNNGIRLVLQIP